MVTKNTIIHRNECDFWLLLRLISIVFEVFTLSPPHNLCIIRSLSTFSVCLSPNPNVPRYPILIDRRHFEPTQYRALLRGWSVSKSLPQTQTNDALAHCHTHKLTHTWKESRECAHVHTQIHLVHVPRITFLFLVLENRFVLSAYAEVCFPSN